MERSHRLILISMCISLGAVVSAVTSLNVALPDLARATQASTTQLQWIVDAYALVFAGRRARAGAVIVFARAPRRAGRPVAAPAGR